MPSATRLVGREHQSAEWFVTHPARTPFIASPAQLDKLVIDYDKVIRAARIKRS